MLTHWIPNSQIIIKADTSDYALNAILSTVADNDNIHSIAFHSHTFTTAEVNYDTHNKELLAIFKAFCVWLHYLEGSVLPIDVITDYKNLKYFATTKVLNCQQACWSEHLFAFNLIIRFHSGYLSTKPDSLTRQWDIYLKEGDRNYAQVNPHNLQPIFSQKQLTSFLHAMALISPTLCVSTITDIEILHNNILESLPHDPLAIEQLENIGSDSCWTQDNSGLLQLNKQKKKIYIPDSNNL